MVLSEPERLALLEPIVARMRAGVLSKQELLGFVVNVAHGGIPSAILHREPTIKLDLTSLEGMDDGRWLPSYLSERRMDGTSRESELDIHQRRIVDAIQGAMRDARVDLPVFFLGSGIARTGKIASDLDIGTSVSLRGQHMRAYDEVFEHLREPMRSPLIMGNKNHVGAVWSHFHLALGISVWRHTRALRVAPTDLYVIERGRDWGI